MITEMKMKTDIKDICEDLPIEYALFYSYCRCLEFKQKPDYGYLRRLLKDLIYKESFNHAIAF